MVTQRKILIVGPGGGRESALAWKLREDGEKVFVTNPNGGFKPEEIARDTSSAAIKQFDETAIAEFIRKEGIDLAIVAGDDALAKGMVDKLKQAGIQKVFGPSQEAAKIESNKAFAKDLMTKQNVATANYRIFTDYTAACSHVDEKFSLADTKGLVVKASGLAQGKGVLVARGTDEAKEFLKALMEGAGRFGDAGKTVVIEELLTGKELSVHALVDSQGHSVVFPLVADYKPVGNGDKGDNTGGMGVYGFLHKGTQAFLEQIKSTVVDPIVAGMQDSGSPFVGLLYPGLMQDAKNSPQVLEYNARFGDPEAQVYMRLLDDNCKLFDLLDACINGNLDPSKVKWKEGQHAVSVTLASKGYPGEYAKGEKITGIDEAEKTPGVTIFHAGTELKGSDLLTSGGRVLHVTAIGSTIAEARERAYEAVDKIKFKGKTYRKDIGLPGTREVPVRLGILLSGGGTTAKSIVEATKPGGQLHGKVEPVCVIANKEDCGGIKKLGADGEGLPTKVISDKGKSEEDFGRAIIAELHKHGANFVSQNGWLPITPRNVIEEFNGRIINQHPGSLNKGRYDFGGQGMYGTFVHAARLLFAKLTGKNLWTEAVAHRVINDVDGGEVVQKVRVPITNDMLNFDVHDLKNGQFTEKVKALQARVLPYEHLVQQNVLEDAAIALSTGTELRPLSKKLPWHGDSRIAEVKNIIAKLKQMLA